MAYNEEVTMMMSVVPGAMTGISAMMGGLASITNVFTDITRQIDASFGLIDASIITASTIVAQFGLNAAQAAGEFEQGLKVAQMVSGQTAQEMDYLRQKSNEFSVSYRMDIDQITEGLQTLGRAGLNSAQEQTEVLENGLNTAKLEGRDLNSVLEELIQNTALLGGNLKSGDFGESSKYLNDLMVATSMTAPITTHDVSETLKYSGGIAAAAGANVNTDEGQAILEDYMGAIAAFAQKGVTGSIAGTALRAFFNKPATQDSSVVEALGSIKLKPEYLWEDDEQTMKPVSEQIKIIQKQMDKLNVSTMDRLQIWSKIVGGKMGQQMMKLDSSDIKELTKDIRASDDASSLAAGTFQTYQSKMKEMTEQGQVAFRQFGEYAAMVLTPILDVLKKIFEFFSNPIASLVAFIAAFELIASAIKRVRGVFSALVEEFKIFSHYMATGEHLYAMRPSTERKNSRNRFTPYELSKKYPDLSTVTAHSREKQAEAEERLLAQGYSPEDIDIMRKSQKLKGSKFLANVPKDSLYTKERVFPQSLYSTRPKDSEIAKILIDNKLWTEEMTNTFYESGRDISATLDAHSEEIARKLFYFNQNKVDSLKALDDTKKIDYKKAREDFGHVNPNKEAEDRLNSYNEFKEKYSGISNVQRFDEEGLVRDLTNERRGLEALGKTYSHNNVAYEQVEKLVTDRYVNAFIKNIEDSIGVPLSYISEESPQKISEHITNALEEKKLMPSNEHHNDLIDARIQAKIREQRDNLMGTAFSRMYDVVENPLDVKNIAMSSSEDFAKSVRGLNLSGINLHDFQRFVLSKFQLDSAKAVLERRQIMASDLDADRGFNLLSDTDIHAMFPREANVIKKYLDNNGGIDPFMAASKKERERRQAAEYDSTLEFIKKRTGLKYSDFTYQTEEGLSKSYASFKDKNLYLKNDDIKTLVKQMYGVDLKEKHRARLAQAAFPYLSDWTLTSHEGGMTNDQFRHFAYSLGATELNPATNKDNRETMVRKLNEHLILKEVVDYKEKIKKINEDLKRQEEALVEFYGKEGYLQEEIARYKQEQELTSSQHYNWNRILSEEQKQYDILSERINTPYISNPYFEGYDKPIVPARVVYPKNEEYNELKKEDLTPYVSSWYNPNARNREFDVEKREARKTPSQIRADELRRQKAEKAFREMGFSDETLLKLGIISGVPTQDFIGPKLPKELGGGKDPEKSILNTLKAKFDTSTFIERATNRQGRTLGWDKPTSKVQKFGNALLNATDLVGGPFFAAMELAAVAVEKVREMYEEYNTNLKTLSENVKNAYSEISSATDSLKQEYRQQNSDATNEDVEQYVLDVYSQRYDDFVSGAWLDKANVAADKLTRYQYDEEADNGSYKEVEEEEKTDEENYAEAVKENTGALYTATAQLQASMNSLVNKMQDGVWGVDGISSTISDTLGGIQDHLFSWDGQGSGFIEEGGFLLTASQKDSNYQGYTEMAGLMLEDFYDSNGNLFQGMQTMLGKDTTDVLSSMNPQGKELLQNLANFSSNKEFIGLDGKKHMGLSRSENLKMQQSMKMDKKSWQAAAKELAKVDMKKKSGKEVTEKDTKRLEGYIKKLATETGLSDIKIRQGLQLQQLQDMYSVAQQVMIPLAEQQAQIAAQHLVFGEATAGSTDSTSAGANDTAAIASVIASYVAVVAQAKAGEAYFEAQRQKGDPDALAAKDYNEYMSKGYGQNVSVDNLLSNIPGVGALYSAGKTTGAMKWFYGEDNYAAFEKFSKQTAFHLDAEHPERFYGQMLTLEAMGEKARNPSWTDKQTEDNAKRKLGPLFDSAGNPLFNEDVISKVVRENYSGAITPALMEQYMGSDIGEVGDTGSGSGSGSGSGDKDKDTGSRKERVDLVLCNKKEIPKLNVNLFKKPPTFTILNKNFKLRDVKINTEDKPKAIMASIKNAFIDVQKRSDPKIIQDEEAVYDPAGATEGNAVPSGTAKTKTNT